MRLAKYITQMGYCSRRKAEQFIRLGEVQVNGTVASISTAINPETDQITVQGEKIVAEPLVYIMLNKPPGYLSTCSPGKERGKSVLDLLRVSQRIYPVGRLDRDSRGLLLLTNDGDLAFSLTHPSHEIEKEYHVETDSPFSAQEEQRLYAGIGLNGKNYRFHRIQRIGDCRYRVILKQGLKRQIRLMAKSVGKKVLNLKRVRIGGLELGDLPEGQWRHLTLEEINLLKK